RVFRGGFIRAGRRCTIPAIPSSCWPARTRPSSGPRRITSGRDSTRRARRSWKGWCRSRDAGTCTTARRTRGSALRSGTRSGAGRTGSLHLSFNEYTIRTPPYAKGSAFKHVYSYVGGWSGSDYVKNILVDEKDHPYTGTHYAWVRARCLGGKTNIWGRLALRL